MARTSSRTTKLRKIEPKFFACRSIGHAWRYTKVWESSFGPIQGFQCTRCRSDKRQQLSPRGHILGSATYSYVEGYLVDGLGFLDRDDRAALRLMSLEASGVQVEVVNEN